MACKNNCKLCKNLIISTAVNFDPATNELIIGLPDGCYNNCCKYCLVVAQPIPTSTTINALVTVAIGTDPTRYPLVDCGCSQVTACNINTRTKYSTVVNTNTVSGVFKLLSNVGCCGRTNLPSLPAPTTDTALAVAELRTTTAPNKITRTTTTTKKEVVANE